MKPYPHMPAVPAAGHISGGFWHPGPVEGCPKCPTPATISGPLDTRYWREVGRVAFAAGQPRIPAADATVREAIAGVAVGGGAAEIMRAWQAGWDAANLAGPVPGVDDSSR